MKLLALDLSTVETGWAVFEDEKYVCSGTLHPHTKLDKELKIIFMAEQALELIRKFKVDELVIENIFFKSGFVQGFLMLAELRGAVQYMWYKVKLFTVNAMFANSARALLKIKATGKTPTERKKSLIRQVNRKFNLKITKHDEADAIILGYAFIRKTRPGNTQHPYKHKPRRRK